MFNTLLHDQLSALSECGIVPEPIKPGYDYDGDMPGDYWDSGYNAALDDVCRAIAPNLPVWLAMQELKKLIQAYHDQRREDHEHD